MCVCVFVRMHVFLWISTIKATYSLKCWGQQENSSMMVWWKHGYLVPAFFIFVSVGIIYTPWKTRRSLKNDVLRRDVINEIKLIYRYRFAVIIVSKRRKGEKMDRFLWKTLLVAALSVNSPCWRSMLKTSHHLMLGFEKDMKLLCVFVCMCLFFHCLACQRY